MNHRIRQTIWSGCYEDSWKGLFAQEESFSHPAKFARGLIQRIYEHLRDQYGLQPGAVIVDPFGGIACGAVDAMNLDYHWVGCELEPRFVALAEENIAKWQRYFPHATARIVQGDSRRLRESIGPVLAECVVGSPPYAGQTIHDGSGGIDFSKTTGGPNCQGKQGGYGTTSGQLGAMPAGSVDAILSSPPYAETLKGDGTQAETAAESRAKRQTPGGSLGQSQRTQGYGSKGNLGNLPAGCVEAVVSSPPYQEQVIRKRNAGSHEPAKQGTMKNGRHSCDAYGDSPENLGNLPAGCVEAVVGSPPFCAAQSGGGINREKVVRLKDGRVCRLGNDGYNADQQGDAPGQLAALPEGTVDAVCGADAVVASPPYADAEGSDEKVQAIGKPSVHHGGDGKGGTLKPTGRAGRMGNTPGQLNGTTGDTFWSAALEIVRESYAILRPGGLAAWVVKAFVRKGAIVDFPGQWKRLCESVGFITVEEIHASLVKTDEHPSLFGESVTTSKSRKSFFRRLHEKQRPDLAIDCEVVWIMRKP